MKDEKKLATQIFVPGYPVPDKNMTYADLPYEVRKRESEIKMAGNLNVTITKPI